MKRFLNFIKENSPTFVMIAIMACLYVFILMNHLERGMHNPDIPKTKPLMTQEELLAKEEIFKQNIMARPELMAWIGGVLFILFVAGFCALFYVLARWKKKEPVLTQSLPQNPVPWGIKHIVEVVVFLLMAEAILISTEIWIGAIINLGHFNREFFLLANSLISHGSTAIFVLYLVKVRFKKPLTEIGLTSFEARQNILKGLLAYVIIVPVLIGIILLLSWVTERLSYEPPPQPVVQLYLRETTNQFLILFSLFVAVVGPVIEEIFFRGFAYKALRTRYGVKRGIVFSAIVFSAVHGNLVAFLPIFLLGVLLAYLYEKTGSLLPSMTLHMVHNLIMVGCTLGFKSLSQG